MQVGHVYRYANRPNEPDSTFTVLKIDEIKGHKVVSISISGLLMKTNHGPDGVSKGVGHFPISLESVLASKPVDTGKVVSIVWPNEGYDEWMTAVNNGKGGYWTKKLDESIAMMESVLNK